MKAVGRTRLLLAVLLASGSIVVHAQQRIKFDAISLREGLSQGSVFSIFQDRMGFMWFGTADGLNRYDGYEFHTYRFDPLDSLSISDNRVIAITEDSSGRLWVGTLGGGLNLFDRETETFRRIRHREDDPASLSNDNVNSLYTDSKGYLWVGTTMGGLNRLDPSTETFERFRYDPSDSTTISSNHIFPICEDASGTLWVGTPAGLNRFDPATRTFKRYVNDPDDSTSISHNYINAIMADRAGTLWVGTVDGLNRMSIGEHGPRFISYHSDSLDSHTLGSSTVWSIFEDRDETLWVGTDFGGINRFDRKTGFVRRYINDPNDPFDTNPTAVRCMYQDRSSTFWVGTNGEGIRTWNPLRRKFRAVSAETPIKGGISANWVRCLYETADGIVWVGTSAPYLDIVSPGRRTATHIPLPGSVEAIVKDKDGVFWLGTSVGLYRGTAKSRRFVPVMKPFSSSDTLAAWRVRTLAFDRHRNLWLGYLQGGLAVLNYSTKSVTRFIHNDNDSATVSGNFVRSIYQDHAGDLWIGTYGGLDRFDEASGSFIHYRYDPGDPRSLSNNNILCVADLPSDSGRIIWVGTFGGGLNKLDKSTGEVTRYTTHHGLPNNVVYGILSDGSGKLWLSTNRGVAQFDPEKEIFHSYDVNDGLQGYEFSIGAYHRGGSGTLYLGGINGFSYFRPDSLRANGYIPPIVLTSIRTPQEILRPATADLDRIELSYATKYVTFEFASLDYTSPTRNQYAFKMEGFDETWTYIGTRRLATFSKLDPGEYRLVVRGTNSDGVWNNTGVSLSIVVTPPFWSTWWFVSVSSAAAFGVGYVAYRRRIRTRVEQARIHGELQSARQVQMGLMPTGDPTVPGLDVSGICIPAHEVGGDFFDYLWLDSDHRKFGIALADVSGKGLNAAMTGVMAGGMLYREIENDPIPSSVFSNINRSLRAKTDKRMFVSMLFSIFDTERGTMTFANAGQAMPLRRRNGSLTSLTGAGVRFPLGMVSDAQYDNCVVRLEKGDIIVFYTDGVSDARNTANEAFEIERLEQTILGLPGDLCARDMVGEIVITLRRFVETDAMGDDISLVIVKVLEPQHDAAARQSEQDRRT